MVTCIQPLLPMAPPTSKFPREYSLGNFDVGGAIGNSGCMHVTIDRGYGRPYHSTVELCSGEVGEDLNRYLANSYQTGSIVIVGTHLGRNGVEAAGGLIVQLLPDHTE